MPKLLDTQLLVLNRAANRNCGIVDPHAISARAPVVRHNMLSALLKKGLIAECDATHDAPVWRKDDSGQNRSSSPPRARPRSASRKALPNR